VRVHLGIMAALLATIVGMALGVPSASAQVEATFEGEDHCTAVVLEGHGYEGGCHIAGGTPVIEWRGLFGTMYLCEMHFEARIDENGEGAIYDQALFVPGTPNPCDLQPCGGPWPLELTSETTAETVLCIGGAFGMGDCHIGALDFHQASHMQLELTTGTTHAFCEAIGSTNAWMAEITLTPEGPGLIVE